MKKMLILAAALLTSLGMAAQGVVYDQTNPAGVRTVICEGMSLGVADGMEAYVALAGFRYKGTRTYSLAVTIGSGHAVEVPEGGACVLTLTDGKSVTLPTVAGGASVLQQVEVDMDDAYQDYRRFAYYNLKAKDLKKIVKKGVAQVELQLRPSSYVAVPAGGALDSLLSASQAQIKGLLDQ